MASLMHQQWPSRDRPPNDLCLLLQQQFVACPPGGGCSSRGRTESYALNAPDAELPDVPREAFISSWPRAALKSAGVPRRTRGNSLEEVVVSHLPAAVARPPDTVHTSITERSRAPAPADVPVAVSVGEAVSDARTTRDPVSAPSQPLEFGGHVFLPRRASFPSLGETDTVQLLRTPEEHSNDQLSSATRSGGRRERSISPRHRPGTSLFARLFSRSRPGHNHSVRFDIENALIANSSAHE